MTKKVLITGGSGSLGRILTRTIASQGYTARILSTRPRGRLVDFGGPHVLTLREMAETWIEVKGIRKSSFTCLCLAKLRGPCATGRTPLRTACAE